MTPASSPAHAMPSADEAIRAAGLRLTAARKAAYEALQEQSHASADDVFARVGERAPGTTLQSVYNALGDFVEAGIVARIEPAGRPRLYELRTGDNHHHIVCTQCGAIADVDCAVGHAPCLTPSDAHGFAVHTAEVTYWGVCPTCAATAA